MKTIVLAICVLAFGYVSAQDLKKLETMIGKWEGNAEMTDQNGKNNVFQTEDVKWGLDGKILIVNGKGYAEKGGDKVFEAYGIIHWDQAQQKFLFNAWTAEGRYTPADAYWEGDYFIWTFSIPNNGGTIKYSLKIEGDNWVEDGNFSRDGETWFPFFHMELKRVGS